MTTPGDLALFLKETRDSREYRRGLAVKLALEGYMVEYIARILDTSPSFVSKAKKAYDADGIAGLQLQYQGKQPFLSLDERELVIAWLQAQEEWSVDQLAQHIEETYAIVFQSRQSYLQLLEEAQMSYKKSQSNHPKGNSERIALKKKRFKIS